MNLSARNATQAETIDRIRLERGELRVKAEAQAARIETLQRMVTWQRNRIAELEAQTTPQAIAERHFK
tara:strand:- start:1 stop:204 length:204 start_codon:yes stop_codon:yes gene_type:complete